VKFAEYRFSNCLSESSKSKYKISQQKLPKTKISFKKLNTKGVIIKIFYGYWKDVAIKPYGKQIEYIKLLGDYFKGFETEKLKSNFNK